MFKKKVKRGCIISKKLRKYKSGIKFLKIVSWVFASIFFIIGVVTTIAALGNGLFTGVFVELGII